MHREFYPSNPYSHTSIEDYKSKKPANRLTAQIIDFLLFTGYFAERISSSGRVVDNRKTYTNVLGQTRVSGSTQYIPGTSTNGTADISAIIEGASVKIEVKIGKDRQSKHQKSYEAAVLERGGYYIIAKDFQSFYEWLLPFIAERKKAA